MQTRTFRGTFNQFHFFRQHRDDIPFSTRSGVTARDVRPVKWLIDQRPAED
jgi:hypothetical protein